MMMLIFNGLMLGLATELMITATEPREVLFWALLAGERVCRMLNQREGEAQHE